MDEINKIIITNKNIPSELKRKIYYNTLKIIKKFPMSFINLFSNLQSIKIIINNEITRYDDLKNILYLNNNVSDIDLISCLILISGNDHKSYGFKSPDKKYGYSLNKGFSLKYSYEIENIKIPDSEEGYQDINNYLFFSKLLTNEKLIEIFYGNGFTTLNKELYNLTNVDNKLINIFELMDKKDNTNDENKKLIELILNIINNINLTDEYRQDDMIRFIYSYICSKYNTLTIPLELKISLENCLNNIVKEKNLENEYIRFDK